MSCRPVSRGIEIVQRTVGSLLVCIFCRGSSATALSPVCPAIHLLPTHGGNLTVTMYTEPVRPVHDVLGAPPITCAETL